MELVYLWVEKYKNIEKQGFNFSPRFKCEYDEEKNELTIDENKDYVSIFPKNINITVIVGENGSGKTSLIDFINTSIDIKNKNSFLFLYIENNIRYYKSNLKISDTNFNTLNKFYFTNNNYNLKNTIINTKSYDINNIFKFFVSIFEKVENIYFNPKSILITEDKEKKLQIIEKLLKNINNKNIQEKELLKINIFVLKLINENFNNEAYINFLCDEYEYTETPEIYDEIQQKTLRTKLKQDEFYKDFLDYLIKLLISLKNNSEKPINPFTNFIKDQKIKYLFRKVKKINSIEDFLNELVESGFIKQRYQTFYNDCKDYFDLEQNYLNKNIQLSNVKIKLINKFKELLDFDFFDNRKVSFNSFSEGEKNLFLSNLETYSKFQEGNKIILLDEIELFLHPQWQKQYINNLLKLFKFNHIHFIFVTHSPFLLSDLPKKNIIYLDKVDENTKDKYPSINIEKLEKGNCLNVSKYVNINPFGANIHTLLSHGFFMKDGLMGEFAKSKISKILKFLNGENRFIDLEVKILPPLKIQNNFFEKNLRPIIEFIGEDFLKEKLFKMYEIKFPKSNEAKIKELENEIKRLKNATN